MPSAGRDTEVVSVPGVDARRVAVAVRELLLAVGEDPDREGLRETPFRVARAYRETFAGMFTDPGDALDASFD
jgi:GTP cyclohydrolase IA